MKQFDPTPIARATRLSIEAPAARRGGVAVLVLALLATQFGPAWAAPEGGRERERGGSHEQERGRAAGHEADRGAGREADRGAERWARPMGPGAAGPGRVAQGQWWDGAHGHAHVYPNPGWGVRVLPPQSQSLYWSGVRYHFHEGVWYTPGPRGYVVVRPPYGAYVSTLPLFSTLLVIGGLSYLYSNGVYYRDRYEGGYEVVPAPVAGNLDPVYANAVPRVFVYPRQNQSAEQQASDEYECHRWAVTQAGFDPSANASGGAIGEASGDTSRRSDYGRARGACLEGRGYSLR